MINDKMYRDTENKLIIIIRHAHRSKKVGPDEDNGLSKKGFVQAKQIQNHFNRVFGKEVPVIISSPKRRCIETVERIAIERGSEVICSSQLDEGGDLKKKTNLFIKQLSNMKAPLVVACSHGDIIPILIKGLIGVELILDKGAWAQFEYEEDDFNLRWIFQNFNFYK